MAFWLRAKAGSSEVRFWSKLMLKTFLSLFLLLLQEKKIMIQQKQNILSLMVRIENGNTIFVQLKTLRS